MAKDLQFCKVVPAIAPLTSAVALVPITIDTLGYGDVMIVFQCGLLAADFLTAITITESETSGSGYGAITGASAPLPANGTADSLIHSIFHIKMDGTRKRYLRVNGTPGAGDNNCSALAILYNPKLNPGALQGALETVDIV